MKTEQTNDQEEQHLADRIFLVCKNEPVKVKTHGRGMYASIIPFGDGMLSTGMINVLSEEFPRTHFLDGKDGSLVVAD